MEYGTIIRKSATEYSWNLGTGFPHSNITYFSKGFPLGSHNFYISVCLDLRYISRNRFDLFLRSFCPFTEFKSDLHVLLRYKNERKDFSLKNKTYSECSNLARINVKDLLEITCTFSNIQASITQGHESGTAEKNNGTSDEESKDENGRAEINDPVKSEVIAELCVNFKDALLDEEDSDITFRVGEQMYPAHKVIIKVRSPVFRAMLKHDMKEKNEGVINIPDCDPLIFRDFLLFIYTGKLDGIANENVCELYHLSDKYDVKGLKMLCVDFILKNLSVDIICDVISLAARHCERMLLSTATDFFIDHAGDILQTVKWQKFVEEHPTEANELFLKTFNTVSRK